MYTTLVTKTLLYVRLKPKINAVMLIKVWFSQLRYYQNDFALCYNNGIGQTDTSLFEDNTIENVYRIVKIKTKKIVNITCNLSTIKL